MNKKKQNLTEIKILLLTIIILITTPQAISDLTCQITQTTNCEVEFTILKLKSVDGAGYNNAHLELSNYASPGYPYALCCSDDGQPLELSCASPDTIEILRLSHETNAHVQFAQSFGGAEYSHPVCMGAGSEDDNCLTTTTACPQDYACLISIASSETNNGYENLTNAHAAECGHYDLNVCCFIDGGLDTPILIHPEDEDHFYVNRLPEFSWSNIENPDGGYANYTLEVSTNTGFTTEIINQTNLNTNTYQVHAPMAFNTYYWRVKAHTQDRESEWSEISTFTIVQDVDVVLEVNSVNFGELPPGETLSTESNAPPPFKFVNYGNVKANTGDIITSSSLWETESLGTTNWRIKARDDTSITSAESQITWLNVVSTINNFIKELQYLENNEVLVDVLIEVPPYETPGTKTSSMNFTWVSAE